MFQRVSRPAAPTVPPAPAPHVAPHAAATPLWSQLATRAGRRQAALTVGERLPSATTGLGPRVSAAPVFDCGTATSLTVGGTVYLAPGAAAWAPQRRALTLAHEAVHAAQQDGAGGPYAGRDALEAEARALAPAVALGQPVTPRLRATPGVALYEDPQGPTAEELRELDRLWEATRGPSRRRAAMLRQLRRILIARRGLSHSRGDMERFPSQAAGLDAYIGQLMGKIFAALPSAPPHVRAWALRELDQNPGNVREIYERLLLSQMNRRAITVDVTDFAVFIDLRFQVRFEGRSDEAARAALPELASNLRAGIDAVWDRELTQPPFVERRLIVRPQVELLASGGTRDPARFLITVRPSDEGPLEFEGRPIVPLEEQQTGDPRPTSVTRTDLGGGVMSIPPRHVARPEVLGHETLHLFGLIDRYGLRAGREVPMRATGGRADPLGAQAGQILDEDLDFIFRELGVYALEAERLARGSPIATSRRTEIDLRHVPTTVEEIDQELMRLDLLDQLPPMAPQAP